MHSLLDAFFSLFGKKAIGQAIGATIIGVIMVGLHFLRAGERPAIGEFSTWLIGGAAAGFTAGLILVSPRLFFGTVFGLLGLAIVIIPINHADGSAATLSEHAVKVGIGAGFMFLSIVLAVSRLRKLARDRNCEPDAAPNGGPATQLGNSNVTEGPPSVS